MKNLVVMVQATCCHLTIHNIYIRVLLYLPCGTMKIANSPFLALVLSISMMVNV